jgi:hypothetical protein
LKSRVTSFLNGGAPRFGPHGGPPVGGFDGPGTFDGPRL